MIQIPFYLLILAWGIGTWGIVWAAWAWTARALVDVALLMVLTVPLLPSGGAVVRGMILPALGSAAAFIAAYAIQPLGLGARVAFTAVVVGPFLVWVAGRGLAEERRALMAGLATRT